MYRHDPGTPWHDPPPGELPDMELIFRTFAAIKWGFEGSIVVYMLELSRRCGCRCGVEAEAKGAVRRAA